MLDLCHLFLIIMILANTANSQHPTCPSQATPGGSCILGKICRYSPVGCYDGVKFATSCVCKGNLRRASYKCTTRRIDCVTNDLECPGTFELAAGQKCDPETVQYCNYNPNGCPGSTDPGIFIDRCFCDPALKDFLCTSFAMLPCN
jgi:hypothetical protein